MSRIGLLGLWANRGAGVVNRTLYQALTDLGHTVYVFSRMGFVYGEPIQESTGGWAVPHVHLHRTYDVAPSVLRSWAQYHRLQAMLFNEEYDLSLVHTMQQIGLTTIGYIDFLSQAQRPFLRWFDQMWSATQRTAEILGGWGQAERTVKIGWGVPSEMFSEPADGQEPYRFVSNQGYLGINARKGLDTILQAYQLLGDAAPAMLIHAQVPWPMAQAVLQWPDELPKAITWEDEVIPFPPGLYHLGSIAVQPSKLEGLGLALVEAMVSGRPVITIDAAPMHEFVTEDTGWLVPVERYQARLDGILFPEAVIDPQALAKAMHEAHVMSDTALTAKAQATAQRAHVMFGWDAFTARIRVGLERVGLG